MKPTPNNIGFIPWWLAIIFGPAVAVVAVLLAAVVYLIATNTPAPTPLDQLDEEERIWAEVLPMRATPVADGWKAEGARWSK